MLPVTLDPTALLRTRAADGLASAEERSRLLDLGYDPDEWAAGRALTRTLLLADDSPELADDVLKALGIEETRPSLRELLRALSPEAEAPELAPDVLLALGVPPPPVSVALALRHAAAGAPELADDVLVALGIAEAALPVEAAIRARAGAAPDLTLSISAALGLDNPGALVAQALRAEQGAPPALWGAVAQGLGLEAPSQVVTVSEAVTAPAGPLRLVHSTRAVAPLPSQPAGQPARAARREGWSLPMAGMLAAAMLLFFFTGNPLVPVAEGPVAFHISAVNDVDIEELSTGSGTEVVVLKFDADAPTIIFIETADEGSTPSDEGGATL